MKRIFCLFSVLAAIFLFTQTVFAQISQNTKGKSGDELLKQKLPQLLGSNNEGTEFYLAFHPGLVTANKSNFIRIYITSAVETKVTLSIPALGITKSLKTIPNGVAEFILFPPEGQMYSKPGSETIKPLPAQVWQGGAIKITSDDPIICYGVTRYQYKSEGYLALPVSSLGTKYTVSTYADKTNEINAYLPSFTSIVGIYDNTKVDFIVGGNTSMAIPLEDGVSEAKAGEKVSRVLNDGDVWLIPGKNQHNDLSGSYIRASKPVNVISGNFCANIPNDADSCNFTIEQEIPQEAWGTKYLVTPIEGRLKNSIIKIFPKFDQTKLFMDNKLIGTIETADGMEGTGWIERRADTGSPRPVLISGDKPIYVMQYNTGQTDDSVPKDPFQMSIVPEEQYKKVTHGVHRELKAVTVSKIII